MHRTTDDEIQHPPGVIDSAAYRDGQRVATVPVYALAEAHRDTDAFLWVGLYEPDEPLLQLVQRTFGFHDLAVEDAHHAHQRPKLEDYGDSLFLVLRTANAPEPGRPVAFGETHVFVGDRYIVTVRHGSLTSHVGLRARCEAEPGLLARGPGFVLHSLMDFVVDQYAPVVEALEAELVALESDIFGGTRDRGVAVRVYRLRRDLMALKRAVTPLLDVSGHLSRVESRLIAAEARPYFQDVNDHVQRLGETIEDLQELSRSALEVNLSLVALAQNDDTKRLAAWAAILAVPTLIAGLYGMNFPNMPELSLPFGYPIALGGMGAACWLLHRQFRRIGWL
jgi:magnesium transporter